MCILIGSDVDVYKNVHKFHRYVVIDIYNYMYLYINLLYIQLTV